MVSFVPGNGLWVLGSCSLHLVSLGRSCTTVCFAHASQLPFGWRGKGWPVGLASRLWYEMVLDSFYLILRMWIYSTSKQMACLDKAVAQSNRSKSLEESRWPLSGWPAQESTWLTWHDVASCDFWWFWFLPVWMTLSTTWPRLRSQPTVQLTSSCFCSQAKQLRFVFLKENLVPLDLSSLRSFKGADGLSEAHELWTRLVL